MKVFSTLKKGVPFDSYFCDGFILGTIYSSYSEDVYSLEELKTLIIECHDLKKEVMLKVDALIEEKEVSALYSFLESLESLSIEYYLFSDWSIYTYFKDKTKVSKLIFYAPTLMCNEKDAKIIHQLGMQSVLSTEETLTELKQNSKDSSMVLFGHGYLPIFYSKRKLLSLHKKHVHQELNPPYPLQYLKEELRNELYPIYENNRATFIFSPFVYGLCSKLKELEEANILLVFGDFLSCEHLIEILSFYHKVLIGEDVSSLEKTLQEKYKIQTGFLFEKLHILQEEDQ